MLLEDGIVNRGVLGDLTVKAREAVGDVQRASAMDQDASEADQVSADSDQQMSDADQSASDADQVSAGIDQQASDRDEAAAARQHATSSNLTPADERAYKTSRDDRDSVSMARQANRIGRARTAGHRGATASQRGRVGHTRDDVGRKRGVRSAAGNDAIVAWELSRRADNEMTEELGAKYRGLLEAAPDAMVVVDEAGTIILLNLQAEKQFGYHREELVGQQVTSIIPKGFAERLIADDLRSPAEALAQQIGSGLELSGRRKDGTEFPIEIMLSPLESAEGVLVTAAIRNISVRKAAEAHLLEAEKLESIGRLAGGIAHDFNNMLFVIHAYAELLAEDLAETNRARLDADDSLRSVGAISHAAERAAELTAQLLAFGRRQVISPCVLDPNAVIAGLEPMVRQLIGTNVQLVLGLDADAWHIRADPGQLDQILVNLVVNARDAMPAGGTVTIDTSNVVVDEPYAIEQFDVKPGPYVLIAVTDTGVGMDRETREHIFEPFYTTKKLGKGTGLGLPSAYGIVRQAGGHVRLASESGAGSSFNLYFPRIDAPLTIDRPGIPATPEAGSGTVLIVEDEAVVREITTRILRRAGYAVIAVSTGAEAMERLAEPGPRIHVLVTDVIMPNMSGISLADLVFDRYPRVGVVFLSGYTAEMLNVERLTDRGAIFVAKPVTSRQLILAVQRAGALHETALP
ncbi:MAG: PAS domain S-box protein [Chloroflexota bacterium]